MVILMHCLPSIGNIDVKTNIYKLFEVSYKIFWSLFADFSFLYKINNYQLFYGIPHDTGRDILLSGQFCVPHFRDSKGKKQHRIVKGT